LQAHDRALKFASLTDVILMTALWALSVCLVNPAGNFPLNDDWSYAITVRDLLQTGQYRPLGWTSMPLLTNVLWGTLFCLGHGFSFNALRASTLVAGWLGMIGTYVLARDLRVPRWGALLVALALGFNAIYYGLSLTYMTDVLFTTLVIWAAVFLARMLSSGSAVELAIGTALALAAMLSRQLALCLPVAFCVIELTRQRINVCTLLRSCVPLLICASGYLGFNLWLSASGRVPALYSVESSQLSFELQHPSYLGVLVLTNLFLVPVMLGLFLAPVMLACMPHLVRSARRMTPGRAGALSAGLLLVLVGGWVRLLAHLDVRVPMQMNGNILVPSGLGPLTLRDALILKQPDMTALPALFWTAATVVGLLGAGIYILALTDCIGRTLPASPPATPPRDEERSVRFLLLGGLLYLVPLLLAPFVFDRYLIPLIPLLGTAVLALARRRAAALIDKPAVVGSLAYVLLAGFGLFAIGAAHDYLAWNRVRWQALEELTVRHHVPISEIDGGFEFNGWFGYDAAYQRQPGHSWWWVHDDTYLVSFGPVPGYLVYREYPYTTWLPPHQPEVAVLLRR